MMQKDYIYFGPTGLALPRNSPIAPEINWVIDSLFQSGISNMLFRKDMTSRYAQQLTNKKCLYKTQRSAVNFFQNKTQGNCTPEGILENRHC